MTRSGDKRERSWPKSELVSPALQDDWEPTTRSETDKNPLIQQSLGRPERHAAAAFPGNWRRSWTIRWHESEESCSKVRRSTDPQEPK